MTSGIITDVDLYGWLRLIAGVGLAGELGAGITLVSELMPKEKRAIGTTIIASVGVTGAVAAAIVGSKVGWQTAYFIGGGLGLALLLLRVGVRESGMFSQSAAQSRNRGNFFALFRSWVQVSKYLKVLLIATPTWYIIGILVSFSPELGKAMGLPVQPVAGTALMYAYIGLACGDLGSGLLSHWLGSRRKTIGLFLVMTGISVGAYFAFGGISLDVFYALCLALGLSAGYWAVFVTTASEQFGTNIRATVTTTAPNFARGMLVLHMWLWTTLKNGGVSTQNAALYIGIVSVLIALVAVWRLDETHGKDLDYLEPL